MRDPERIDPILEEIRLYWKAAPDLRFLQLVLNATANLKIDPYVVEDEVFLELLRRMP